MPGTEVRTIKVINLARIRAEWAATLDTDTLNRAVNIEDHANCFIVTTENGTRIRFAQR